jgi:uncharacterized protein (TIGR02679 family)
VTDLRGLFGGPEYARLFAAARKRVEEAGGTAARSTTLDALTDAEGEALAGLFGLKRRPSKAFRLDLMKLDQALRDSAAQAGLRDVLRALYGPLKDRKALRASERAAEEALWREAEALVASRSPLVEWLVELRSQGLLRRAARAAGAKEQRLLAEAMKVAELLPAAGTSLAVLAATATGDAHALDVGRPLCGLILRAAAKLAGRVEVSGTAAGRRKLWEEVGVVCDPLSPHALVLGLRPWGEDHLSRYLRESSDAGEPVKLTLAQITRHSPALPAGTVVSVCENPSVVSVAAERLGRACQALVCTEGVPSTAVMTLLEGLHRMGALIRFHGDFDWGGIRIANEIFLRCGASPWRFGSGDYRRAVDAGLGSPGLVGAPATARWDAELEGSLRETDQAVFEERVVEVLVRDLKGRI